MTLSHCFSRYEKQDQNDSEWLASYLTDFVVLKYYSVMDIVHQIMQRILLVQGIK